MPETASLGCLNSLQHSDRQEILCSYLFLPLMSKLSFLKAAAAPDNELAFFFLLVLELGLTNKIIIPKYILLFIPN